MNIIDVFSYYNSKLNVYAYYPRRLLYYSILNKNYTKYYSINRTVVINRGEFLKSVYVGSKQVPWMARPFITFFQHLVTLYLINLRYQFMCSVIQDY